MGFEDSGSLFQDLGGGVQVHGRRRISSAAAVVVHGGVNKKDCDCVCTKDNEMDRWVRVITQENCV